MSTNKPQRYYAECAELHSWFGSNWHNGWQVFDRWHASPEGQTLAIAFCINRYTAFLIRDSLNKLENEKCVAQKEQVGG